MKYVPHDYQKQAIKKCVKHPSLGLILDPGLGKTSIILEAFKKLKYQGNVKGMFVICPLNPLYDTWLAEIAKWDSFKNLSYSILHGLNKDKALKKKSDIYLINPEGLPWLVETLDNDWPFDMLVVDESTEFKSGTTKRFKLLKLLLSANKFESSYILTGTPAPNSLLDLFSQIYILDQGDSLGRYYTHYRNKYFESDYMGWKWTIRPGAKEEIYKSIDHLVMRLDAMDHIKLPELTVVDRWFNLPLQAQATYNELKKEFIVQLKQPIKAVNAAVLTNKLRQITNGSVYHDNGRTFDVVHTEKDKLAAGLIKELSGQKVVVSYEFNNQLAQLRNSLKKEFNYTPLGIGSGMSKSLRAKILKDFKEGDSQILLGQVSSIALGMNLQVSHNMIMHGVGWNLGHYEQLIRRLWRQGQEHPVIINRLLARNTIDEDIVETLNKKNATQKDLLNYLRNKYL